MAEEHGARRPEARRRAARMGLVAGLAACLAGPALAEEVVLKGFSGDVTISGELVDFADGIYVIATQWGDLRVRAAEFSCEGAACPSAAEGPVAWDVSLWGKRRAFTEHVERIAELVAEKTEGEFTLNLDYGGLSPARENLDGIAAGSFEMAQFCNGYHPDKTPSLGVLELPFLGVETLDQEVAISRAVYAHPAAQADLARWNATLLMPSPQPQNNIMGTGFPPISLDSFRGMKVRATGGLGKAIEALGGEPITIPAPGVNAALQDGTVSAVAFAPHAHMSFGTIEAGSWWTTNLNPGTSNCPVVVNTDALGALTPAHRVALLSSVDEALEHYVANYEGVTMAAWGPALKERQIIEITITDEIVAAIDAEVAGPAAEGWIAGAEAEGLPGRALYDLVKGVLKEMR